MKAEIKSEPTFRCRARDPYQLDNVVETADPVRVAALAARRSPRGAARLRRGECRGLADLAPMDGGSPHLAAQPQ